MLIATSCGIVVCNILNKPYCIVAVNIGLLQYIVSFLLDGIQVLILNMVLHFILFIAVFVNGCYIGSFDCPIRVF